MLGRGLRFTEGPVTRYLPGGGGEGWGHGGWGRRWGREAEEDSTTLRRSYRDTGSESKRRLPGVSRTKDEATLFVFLLFVFLLFVVIVVTSSSPVTPHYRPAQTSVV